MAERPPRLPRRTPRPADPITEKTSSTGSAVLTPPSAPSAQTPEPAGTRAAQRTGPTARRHLSPVDDGPQGDQQQDPTADEPEVSDGSAGRAWRHQRAQTRTERVRKFWDFFEGGNPYTNYWLVLGATIALSAIGLTMVLSSTSVDSAGNAYTTATRQAAWALIGVVGMFAITLMPTRWLGGIGWFLMIVSGTMLALVAFTPLGVEVNGSTNWLAIGPVRGQPSEFAKLALVLWGAAVLSKKGSLVSQFFHWMTPFVAPGAVLVLALVLAGGDLGTSVIIILIVGTLLFTAGVKMRYFLLAAVGAAGAVAMLMVMTPYRMMRFWAWLGENCDHPTEPCYQTQQGIYALASGGFWGVGLGQSRQKWAYIPEVENDFIFTIIGEELGLLGTVLVLGLFAALIIGIFRVANGTEDQFIKLVCMGIAGWLVGQAFINIAMVSGLMPVVGVPLPFISYGGSALTCALIAIGVVLNFARRQRLEARKGSTRRRSKRKRSTLAPLKKA